MLKLGNMKVTENELVSLSLSKVDNIVNIGKTETTHIRADVTLSVPLGVRVLYKRIV